MQEIIVNPKLLSAALGKLTKVNSGNVILPILESVVFSAGRNNKSIQVLTSNLEITAMVSVGVLSHNLSEEFAVNSKKLQEITNLAKYYEEMKLEFNELYTVIFFGKTSFKIPNETASDFPETPKNEQKNKFIFPANYKTLILDTAICCGADDLRPAMTGVYFGIKSVLDANGTNCNVLDICATDAIKLNVVEGLHFDGTVESDVSCIVPKKALDLLSSFLGTDDEFEIYLQNKNIFFKGTSYEIAVRLIDARFPDYKMVIPKNENCFTVEKDILLNAVKVTSIAANTTTNLIIFKLDPINGTLAILGEDIDYSFQSQTEIDVTFNDKAIENGKIEIGMNAKSMIALLPKHDGDVHFYYLQPNRAVLLKSKSLITSLSMPVMLGN